MTPEQRVAAAKDAIVHAARAWYVGRGNVEAPLAAAVVELQRAEEALQDPVIAELSAVLAEK